LEKERKLQKLSSHCRKNGKTFATPCLLFKANHLEGDSVIIDGMLNMRMKREKKFLIEQMTNNLSIIKRGAREDLTIKLIIDGT
jgi:hypothetical protein